MPAQQCTRHQDRETYRICGRCERPFCPDCLVDTPVGGRCRDCARPARSARLIVAPWRWPLVALTAMFGGLIGSMIAGRLGFFALLLSFVAGHLIAGGVLAASGRKPGKALAVVTVLFIVVGAYLAVPVMLVAEAVRAAGGSADTGQAFAAGLRVGLFDIWMWIIAAIMAVAAYTRIR